MPSRSGNTHLMHHGRPEDHTTDFRHHQPGKLGRLSQAAAHKMVLQWMFQAMNLLQHQLDDDFVDRLHYFYSCSFLIMMSVLVSFKQFGGRPLECWYMLLFVAKVPAMFTSSWEAYAEMYCWTENTYWLPFDEDIPRDVAERDYRKISYYQWVPFFILIQAFLFYTPCLFWRLTNGLSGIQLCDIVSTAKMPQNIDPDCREKSIASLTRHIESILKYQKAAAARERQNLHKLLKCLNVRYYEWYLTMLYIFVKCLYAANVLFNLYLMNLFLETDQYSVYGIGVLGDLLARRGWKDSGNFPRVTMCDFEIRVMGNIQKHTVQCVLVINIFTEKLFVLLWLWFSLLTALTIYDLIYWCIISLWPAHKMRFARRHLETTENLQITDAGEHEIQNFVDGYLKFDGIFVLRMIGAHAGIMFCSELMQALYLRYLASKNQTPTSTAIASAKPTSNNVKSIAGKASDTYIVFSSPALKRPLSMPKLPTTTAAAVTYSHGDLSQTLRPRRLPHNQNLLSPQTGNTTNFDTSSL